MNSNQSLGALLADRFRHESTLVPFSPEQRVFHQDDKVKDIYVVQEGRLRLLRVLRSGAPLCLQVAGPGMVLAEASAFADTYHCSAEADTAGCALALPVGLVRRVVRDDVELSQALVRHLASVVMSLRSAIEIRSIRRADDRVLAWLEIHQPATGAVHLDGTIKDWASEIGLSHEALYRALASLEARGRIIRDGATIAIGVPNAS